MAEPIRWLALGYSVPVNPSPLLCGSTLDCMGGNR